MRASPDPDGDDAPSNDEWDSQANDEDGDDAMPDADDESDQLDAEEDEEEGEPRSLVVTLKTRSSPIVEIKPGEESANAGALEVEVALLAIQTPSDTSTYTQSPRYNTPWEMRSEMSKYRHP